MTRVLLAFDKFKGSLTAHAAVGTAAAALRESHPDWRLELVPLADGGEGFARILTEAVGGRMLSCAVTGPRGAPVTSEFGLVPVAAIPAAARDQLQLPAHLAGDSTVAVIEMASASGLALLDPAERDPWKTSTRGTGELMRYATEAGATAILLGVGGSATHDLGLGALSALGLGFRDAEGTDIPLPVPAEWTRISRISGRVHTPFPPVYIACDVTNPLLGPRGAAAVYAPQKGLDPADYALLESESERVGQMLCTHCRRAPAIMGEPGAGAAGGLAFGLMIAADAKLLPGFELVAAWLDLDKKMAAAQVVITGEGCFDESSLEGKGPGAVVARARSLGKPVHVFAGKIQAAAPSGLCLHPITPAGTPLDEALRDASSNLAAAVHRAFPASPSS